MSTDRETFSNEVYRQAFDRGRHVGRSDEAAMFVLRLLAWRGIMTTSDDKARVLNCSDLATLDRWLDFAFSAKAIDEVFDPERVRIQRLWKFLTPATSAIHRSGYAMRVARAHAAQVATHVLRYLSLRGIEVTEAQRCRITDCSDLDVLDRYIGLMLSVSSADELFA